MYNCTDVYPGLAGDRIYQFAKINKRIETHTAQVVATLISGEITLGPRVFARGKLQFID